MEVCVRPRRLNQGKRQRYTEMANITKGIQRKCVSRHLESGFAVSVCCVLGEYFFLSYKETVFEFQSVCSVNVANMHQSVNVYLYFLSMLW